MEWSPELRVLVAPTRTFRQLSDAPPASRSWLARPLLLALLLGATVSLQASGRTSARLVLDGMIAFAFVPAFMIIAMAIVYRRRPRSVAFGQAVDIFFVANAPWLVWLLAFDVWRAFLTSAQASTMLEVPYYLLLLSFLAVAIWSTYVDFQFFRVFLSKEDGRPARDLLLVRVLSWLGIIGYFAGHEFWEYFASLINV
jgi:hypothetical protein